MRENTFIIFIAYKPPFDWNTLLQYYSKHCIPHIEEVSETHYQRIFKAGSSVGFFKAENDEKNAQIKLTIHTQDPKALLTIENRVRKMFDLNSDPVLIQNQFATYPFFKELWDEFPGLRIARGYDPFEIAIGTVLGQVVSVQQAARLMGELVRHYGEKIVHPLTQEEAFLFPTSETLFNASLDEIKTTGQRKKAIKEICRLLIQKELSFDEYQDPEAFKKQLKNISGIGNWSSEYISLRALGDTNAFPKDDLILKRALSLDPQFLDLRHIEPWKGYLAVYIWKKYAESLSKQRNKKEAF